MAAITRKQLRRLIESSLVEASSAAGFRGRARQLEDAYKQVEYALNELAIEIRDAVGYSKREYSHVSKTAERQDTTGRVGTDAKLAKRYRELMDAKWRLARIEEAQIAVEKAFRGD